MTTSNIAILVPEGMSKELYRQMVQDSLDSIDAHTSSAIWCPEDPQLLAGQPIGQYHCPVCGCMVIAAVPHLAHDEGCSLQLNKTHHALSPLIHVEVVGDLTR